MEKLLHDIVDEADVRVLVDTFYDKALRDELLRPVFVEVAGIDVSHHLPKMYAFWSSMLLGTHSYSGQPFPMHERLLPHITVQHFSRGLELFDETVDGCFFGENASTAKQRARNIAYVFQTKMGLLH